MRKLFVLVIAACALAVLAATAMAATRTVKVGDDYFVRSKGTPKVTVSKRDDGALQLQRRRQPAHGHAAQRAEASSSCSDTCRRTLKKRGTYRLYCTIHGASDQSMRLVVE